MKKVLLVAYPFPPSGEVGIYRTIKFAKYLPQFGWSPHVLTVSNGKFTKYDADLSEIVPEHVIVHRAPAVEWFNTGENKPGAGKPKKRGIGTRIYARLCLMLAYFMIPDNKVSWVPFAVARGIRVVREEGIQTVYVTGKPFSSFLIGVLIKMFCNTKLVIDYRDPWTQNITYNRRSPIHHWIEKRMERYIIRNSDVVIANTRINEKLLVSDFGHENPHDKFVTIHNGFDDEDFDRVAPKRFDKFTLTYAGAFYFSVGSSYKYGVGDGVMQTYSPFFFLEALKQLVESEPEIGKRIQLNLMGVLGQGIEPVIKEMGLGGVVNYLGYVGYDEHLSILKGSDALLLVLSKGEKSRGWIPSKFFSYLGSGNPVLALVPEGEIRDIIRASEGGVFVEPDDLDGIVNGLKNLYKSSEGGKVFARNEDEVRKFSRKHLTSLLAAALENAEAITSRSITKGIK